MSFSERRKIGYLNSVNAFPSLSHGSDRMYVKSKKNRMTLIYMTTKMRGGGRGNFPLPPPQLSFLFRILRNDKYKPALAYSSIEENVLVFPVHKALSIIPKYVWLFLTRKSGYTSCLPGN